MSGINHIIRKFLNDSEISGVVENKDSLHFIRKDNKVMSIIIMEKIEQNSQGIDTRVPQLIVEIYTDCYACPHLNAKRS